MAGLLIGLALVLPTFIIEEFWRGRPLIDQGGEWWVVPAVVMAVGFFVGGLIVGLDCRRLTVAFRRGLLVAALTVGLTFVVDLFRRHALGQILTLGVEDLWLLAGLVAVLVGGLGAIVGCRFTRPKGGESRSRKRRARVD